MIISYSLESSRAKRRIMLGHMLLLLLANCALITAQCNEVVECTVSEYGELKPHPVDCHLYYYCNENGTAVLSYCGANENFDIITYSCLPVNVAVCLDCSTTTESTSCPIPTCDIAEAGMLKAYPPDCTKYIYCNELGESVLSLCQFEQHFNEYLGLCVAPENSTCQNCGGINITPEVTIAVCAEIPKCSQIGEILPFPPDCTKYIYCDGSEWGVLSLCGLNQHFSPSQLRCLPILEANCPVCEEIVIPTTASNISTPETVPICEPTKLCTQEGELLPYPSDCTKYIYCDGTETGYISVCVTNKHFSPTLLNCLPISEAKCPLCQEISTPTSTVKPIRECESFDTPSCRLFTYDTRRAYPPNCNMYIRCTLLYEDEWFSCPEGEIFNQKNESCELVPTNGACEPCEPGPGFITVPPTSVTETPLQ